MRPSRIGRKWEPSVVIDVDRLDGNFHDGEGTCLLRGAHSFRIHTAVLQPQA